MSNLDSPRGLVWGRDGALFVVESGTAEVTTTCAVSRHARGRQERIATGSPSAYLASAADIIGPADIICGFGNRAYLTIGWGAGTRYRTGRQVGGA